MDNNSSTCDLCKVTFGSETDSILHFKGKKHLKLSEQQKNINCGVYITGFSRNQSKEDALQYFSKFGGIEKSIVGSTLTYMIIVYEKEEQAAKVISLDHSLGGRQLKVEKRQAFPHFALEESVDWVFHNDLICRLKDITNFENQVHQFVQMTTPDLNSISWAYNLVNWDVYKALSYSFQQCYTFNFGSSTTYLQMNSSDLDIYVDIRPMPVNERNCLKAIRFALTRSRLFHNIIDIPTAKIPIVKAIHKQTGMKCDINFKNMLGVENSKLIRYYLSLDSRLRPVMLVIKYWAKIQGISGRNHLFTSYSLVMMFIFYLQQCYSFPSVYDLQRHTVPTDPRVIWNMNIVPITTLRSTHIHSVPLLEILKGFFRYYSTFKFDSEIICPYLGRTVEKQCFSDINLIPEQMQIYKNNLDNIAPLKYDKPVCLQDPFEHNANTSRIIFKNILDRYISVCSSSLEILSSNNQNMFIKLFDVIQEKEPEKKKDSNDPDSYNIILEKTDFQSDSNTHSAEIWYDLTLDFCCTVFEKIFKLDIKLKENNKTARVANQQDVHDSDNIKQFHALSFVNVWDCRNISPVKIKDKLDKCKTTLDKEIAISDFIWEENTNIKPTVPIFECDIIVTYLKDPTRINIEVVKRNSYKKIFKSFGLYISTKIPQWFTLHTKKVNEVQSVKSSGKTAHTK